MHRSLAMLLLALVAAGCGPGPRETEIPEIPDRAVGRTPVPEAFAIPVCRLSAGTGIGAEVVAVDGATPAGDVLQTGDIIVEADGEDTPTSASLIATIRSRQIGDVIDVRVARPGAATFDTDVELVEHFDAPGSPMMGVTIRTAVNLRDIESLASTAIDDPLARVVSLDGRLYAVDALQGTWSSLEGDTPLMPWTAAGGAVYVLEEGEPDSIVNVIDRSQSIPFDVTGWDARWVLGSQDGLVLLYADRLATTTLEAAVFALRPEDGQVEWTWVPRSPGGGIARLPVLAVTDPSRNRTLVATADIDEEGNTTAFSFVLLDRDGQQASIALPPEGSLPQDSQAIGWHDAERIAYLQGTEDRIVLWNTATGDVDDLLLPSTEGATQLVPIGDGEHFMLMTADRLDLITGGDNPNITPLAVDCIADEISVTAFAS